MVNTSRRFKLEYNDVDNGTTVIAETGQDTGALKIDRHYHQRRKRDPDILKVWLEGTNFGNSIPTRKGKFGDAQNNTDEPEILYKQYNPDTNSFDTKGRFFAKNTGTIDEDGRLALKLYSFMRFTERQQVDTPKVTTDVEEALNEVLPPGYVADVPAGATVPSVDGYEINARREKGYHELTRDYKFVINFTANLDANNDYKVKFEPEGFGGTVDTLVDNQQAGSYAIQDIDTANDIFTVVGDRTDELVEDQAIEVVKSSGNDDTYTISALNYDSNNNETDITVSEDVTDSTADGLIIPGGQAVFKVWEKDKTDAIINKVTVEGTDSNGITITGTATNQTQIDNFGEKFLKVKRGYIESQSDADTIAEKYLVPGLKDNGDDITTVPENGTVKTTVYSDNVLNDSFQVVSSRRNIDDTYTVASQKNFWPEAATVIEFEFEAENLEEAARESENLRDERGRLYPDTTTDVGGQTIDQSQSNTTTASADNSTQEDDEDPFVDGNTGTSDIDNASNSFSQAETLGGDSDRTIDLDFVSGETEYTILSAYVQLNAGDKTQTTSGKDFEVQNLDTGTTYISINGVCSESNFFQIVDFSTENIEGDDIEMRVTDNDGIKYSYGLSVAQVARHSHPALDNGGTLQTALHEHNVDVNDAGHGDTGDPSTHELQGQTETGQNINTATEDKTDR